MATFELLPVLLSFLYIWILFSPSLGQDEAAGPVDTEKIPGVDYASNMMASNASSSNVTTGEEIVDSNSAIPMNTTDLDNSTATNVTAGTGNAITITDDLNTNSSLVNTTSGSVSLDGNTTLSDNSTLTLSDVNSTASENSTFVDNITTLSNSNAAISDNNATISESNLTTSDGNMTTSDFNVTSSVNNSNMSDDMTKFNNMTMSGNMTLSGKMTMLENMTSENMTAVNGDDLFSVNVTTNNDTDIVIGGIINSTFLVDSNITSSSDTGTGTSGTDTGTGTFNADTGTGTFSADTGTGTSSTDTGTGTPGTDTGTVNEGFGDNTGQATFDNPPSGGVDPFEDPFGNPFGDGTDSGDPFGEEPFGPENPTFDLCTESPCEPAILHATTPKPVTQPPPPPPPPPPSAATKAFDRLFNDQEQFELKRLPNFAFPPANPEIQSKQNRQDAFEELRKHRIARLRALFSSFNAGVPAVGGLSFFNPSKEFSSLTQNAGNQINFPNSGLSPRENTNQFPSDNDIFSSPRLRENTANSNGNNVNLANSNAHKTSENIIEQPAETVRPFNPPPSLNRDPATPTRIVEVSRVVPGGVAPPPPPPPQLDKSINRDSTFIKLFGQIGTREPERSKIGSTNTVNTNTNSANTNNNFANTNNNFANTNNNFANTNNNFANTNNNFASTNNNFANTNNNFANTHTNFANTNTNFVNTNTNSANRKTQSSNVNIGTINTGKQPFAWPYQVPGSSGRSTSSKTASAQRVVSSVVNEGPALSSWLDTTPFLSDSAGGRIIDTSAMSSISSSNTIDKTGGQAASRIGIPFVGLGDLDTFNIKEKPANTADRVSSGGSTTSTGRNRSPPVVPGVPLNADTAVQNHPMNVNSNPFSARRPGVPSWERTDPALVEFGTSSRSSMPSKNLANTWRSAQLPIASSKTSQNSRSSGMQQNKPPTRDPPFIFKPKPSSNLGRNIFDNRRQSSTSDIQQPPPPPSKTEASLFNPSKFEQPPPPRNLPFSNIPPPPPPPGRIGYDASEIFAKITGASFGRSGTGESVITTKRSPRLIEDRLSAMNGDPGWDNTFFNHPAVKKNPSGIHKPFVLPSVPKSFLPAAENNANPFQNTYPLESLKTETLPEIYALVTTTEEALTTTMFPETTTIDTLPSSVDPLSDYATATTLPDSSPGDVSFTTDTINIPTETTTTTVPVATMNEYVTTTVPVVESSTNPLIDLQGSSTQASASSPFIASNAATSSKMLNQMPNQPNPSSVVPNTEPLLTSKAQPADNQAKLREFTNAAEICRDCNFINGYCRLELPGNCNRFIECSKHDREVRAFEKECSHGLFWHQGNLTCERPLRVKCEFDPCLNRGVSNHTYIGKCRAYWSCKRSYSSARCCAKGYGYGLQDGTYGCIPMPDCQDDGHCMSKEERANLTLINANKPKVCTLMNHPTDPFKYMRGSHSLPCAPGTRFDQEECTCITSQAAPISRVCAKDMYLDFEGLMSRAFMDKSGRGNTLYQNNVWTDDQGIAKFNKDSTITLWKYSNQNIGSSIAITFRFLSYRYTSRMQTLLSNCDQLTGIAAIDITLDTWKSVIDFKIETTHSPGNKISLAYNPLQWNNVTLIYDGGSFVAAVDDAYELMFIQGEIPSKHPPLVIGGCSAKKTEGLLGFVDDVSIYNGCIPEDLKNTYLFARK